MLTSGSMILTMSTEDKLERVKYARNQKTTIQMVDIKHDNYEKKKRRALRTVTKT